MWAVVAVVSFAVGLILWLASVSRGVFLTPTTFEFIGFIALSIEHVAPGWRPSRS